MKKYLNLIKFYSNFESEEKTCQNKPLCSAESGAERARESIVTVGGVISLFLPSFDMHCNKKRIHIMNDKFCPTQSLWLWSFHCRDY